MSASYLVLQHPFLIMNIRVMMLASLALMFGHLNSAKKIPDQLVNSGGSITIKWDLVAWTPDGYVAIVKILNYQEYRHVEAPGWTLSWTWRNKEVIWEMLGAQASMQGDCSVFHGVIPHCCKRSPAIIDLLPDAADKSGIGNCCKSGVLSTFSQDKMNYFSVFQMTVGSGKKSNFTTYPPKDFRILAPGPGYQCGPVKKVKPSLFPSTDGRRHTQALLTWKIECNYSQALARKSPSCCVSISAFYNNTIIPCPTCSCNCGYNATDPRDENAKPMCLERRGLLVKSPGSAIGTNSQPPQLYCTSDMCPVKIHWHVKANYFNYWRAKITIINRNLYKNYSEWNVVVQHPNLNSLTSAFSFNFKPLSHVPNNDSALLWGIRYYNDMLLEAGPSGNVQSEFLFKKNPKTFTLHQGWAFPRRIYFNGDECVIPDVYPYLPNSANSFRRPLMRVSWLAVLVAFMKL